MHVLDDLGIVGTFFSDIYLKYIKCNNINFTGFDNSLCGD